MKATILVVAFTLAARSYGAPHRPQTFPKNVGGPDVTFSRTSVQASKVKPGVVVYFASISIGGSEYLMAYDRYGSSAAANDAGLATVSLPGGISARSVWIIVDGSTGGYTVASPHGTALREMDIPGSASPSANGAIHRLQLTRHAVDLFMIRPGTGIWSAYLVDGGSLDGDGHEDGRTDASLASLAPTGTTTVAAPASLEPGDILLFVDRRSLEFAVAQQGR